MKKNNINTKKIKKAKIEESDGLKIFYDKDELKSQLPHLIEEISKRKKSIKIDSVNNDVEQENEEKPQKSKNLLPNELYNPGVIDFLRRCTKNEDAFKILDFLIDRNEITQKDYSRYKKIISQAEGLKKLIDESGGLKLPGYYMRKYYKNEINDQEINSKKD
jgi:hypothetical protein